MELGEKLRQARLEAGLSQRQLCGDSITRNMLSLIEHGAAKPSMDTLKLLAARLEKPVSFFLEEDALASPNQTAMETARKRFDAGDYAAAVSALEAYRMPDPVYDREQALLLALSFLELAEQAIGEGRYPYALELLDRANIETVYCGKALSRRRLLLLGRIPGQKVSHRLPSLDAELVLRAGEALAAGYTNRARCLLEAAQEQEDPQWNLLRGRVYLDEGKYREAARCLHIAEAQNPKETAPLLEAVQEQADPQWNLLRGRLDLEEGKFREAARCLHIAEAGYPKESAPLLEHCYRELQDYKRAYEYACKQK